MGKIEDNRLVAGIIDYEQSLFPTLVRPASENKSVRKINRRRAKTGSERRAGKESVHAVPLFPRGSRFQFSRGAKLFFSAIFFSLARRTKLGKPEGMIVVCYIRVNSRGGGGGDSNIKKVGMLVENVEIDP